MLKQQFLQSLLPKSGFGIGNQNHHEKIQVFENQVLVGSLDISLGLKLFLVKLKKMTLQASFSRKWFFCEAMLWQHYIPQCCKPMPSLPQLILFKRIM